MVLEEMINVISPQGWAKIPLTGLQLTLGKQMFPLWFYHNKFTFVFHNFILKHLRRF